MTMTNKTTYCCHKARIPLCALVCGAVLFARGGQAVAVIGFEKWNDSKGQPAGEDWRWGFSHRGTNGFTVCELSEAECHGGRASLHLKDANTHSLNHTMWYQFTKDEAKSMEGKVMRVSAWIKQVSASDPRSVGIALFANGSDGKSVCVRNGVGTTGASDWASVQISAKMPEKVQERLIAYGAKLIPASKLAREAGSPKSANVVLLGALAASLPFSVESWEEIIASKVPPKTIEANIRAFHLGLDCVKQ